MSVELKVFETSLEAAEACGGSIFSLLESARAQRGVATLAVSGGSTPRIMFEWMARQGFDWRGVHLFWVDERCVPITDSQSNFRMTKLALLDPVRLDPSQVHRVPVELEPEAAAGAYTAEIRRVLRLGPEELPSFDVLQRGMGPDAHTASLFPGEPLIADQTGLAGSVWVEKFGQHRVTLLRGVLERAANTLCLATGEDKAKALARVLEGSEPISDVPSKIASPVMVWFLDRAARPGGDLRA